MLRKAEADFIERLVAFLREPANAKRYSDSQGVCLRQLNLLVRAAANDDTTEFLLRAAARHFEELAEDMRSFALKHYATRRQLANDDESDAWMRGVIHTVGARNCSFSKTNDGEI